MKSTAESAVAEIVARFIELRRSGRRESVDRLVEGTCDAADVPAVREEVLRRLSQHGRTARGIGGSSAEVSLTTNGDREDELPELDGYYVIDLIGRGGMGVVYEAYQQSTGRRVAIKMLSAGARSQESLRRRFEREVELAARLQHPHVVSILDSGVHRGRYYFVMEYIDGRPLDEVMTPGEADAEAVLSLIAVIAEAVDYAHQRGVLHRDLKPSNILIDDGGRPHLVDFGLAKAIDRQETGALEATLSEPGQLLGTIGYMSPEQSRGRIAETSVRSDVYSLGAVAYELLTGELPCSTDGPLTEVLSRIAEMPPVPASQLREKIDPDVDAVLSKALEKSPEGRYPTAGEFAADIHRHLAGEAVTARRASFARRLRRTLWRHRRIALVVSVSLLAILAVATGAFLSVIRERDRARLAEQTARQQARRAERVKGFLRDTLGFASPDVAQRAEVRFVDQLDHAEGRVQAAFAGLPLEEADVRHILGHYYMQRSAFEQAEGQLRSALAIRRSQLGDDHPDTAATAHELADVLHAQDRYEEAEALYRSSLETWRRSYGDRHVLVAQDLNDLAWLLKNTGRYAEAESLYLQALTLRRELLGDRHADVAETLNDLAHLYYTQHDAARAEPLFREALAIRQDPAGGERSNVLIAATMASLGGALTRLDRLDEAQGLLSQALDIRRRLLGDRHADTIISMNELGLLLREKGRYVEAESLLREALALRVEVHGPTHSRVAVSMVNLALVLQAQQRYEESRSLYEQALDVWQKKLGLGDHENVAGGLSHLANLYRETGLHAEAERYAVQVLEMRLRLSGGDATGTPVGDSKYLLGRIKLDSGDAAGAAPLLGEALAVSSRTRGSDHHATARIQAVQGACELALGRHAKAEADLLSAFEVLRRKRPPPNRDTMETVRWIIELYETQSRPDEAAAYKTMLTSN